MSWETCEVCGAHAMNGTTRCMVCVQGSVKERLADVHQALASDGPGLLDKWSPAETPLRAMPEHARRMLLHGRTVAMFLAAMYRAKGMHAPANCWEREAIKLQRWANLRRAS